jgi:hypothetical protein
VRPKGIRGYPELYFGDLEKEGNRFFSRFIGGSSKTVVRDSNSLLVVFFVNEHQSLEGQKFFNVLDCL